MGLKLTNRELNDLVNSMALNNFMTKPLPARISYPLAVLMDALRSKIEIFNDERMKLVERLCDRDDDGNLVQDGETFFFNEHREEFQSEFDDLLNCEVEVAADKVVIDGDALDSIDILLSPADMAVLLPIIDFKFRDPAEGIPITGDNVISMEDRKGEK